MNIEHKKDMLGKYIKTSYPDGKVTITRFFRELGISVTITSKHD